MEFNLRVINLRASVKTIQALKITHRILCSEKTGALLQRAEADTLFKASNQLSEISASPAQIHSKRILQSILKN
jgi:hypothetical protein